MPFIFKIDLKYVAKFPSVGSWRQDIPK